MKRDGPTRSGERLLAGIGAEIERRLAEDGPAKVAASALGRLGLAVVVTVEAVPGSGAPTVRIPEHSPRMPEWSPEDEEILRSLGIGGHAGGRKLGSTSKPGRRQPQ